MATAAVQSILRFVRRPLEVEVDNRHSESAGIGEAIDRLQELANIDATGNTQQQLTQAAEELRIAAGRLLEAADRSLAELHDGRIVTRALLDRLEARLAGHG
jgi:hypothetical protein